MSRLSDELYERALRVVRTRGKPVVMEGPKSAARYWDDKINILFSISDDDDEFLQIWQTGSRHTMFQVRNGVPQQKTIHFSDEIYAAVKHLREMMILDDIADGWEPPPESILRQDQ